MKTIEEMIAVMTAYKEGEQIEYHDECNDVWRLVDKPEWDWQYIDYRIKPEEQKPTYRPYLSAKEFDEAIKEHGCWLIGRKAGTRVMIVAYNNVGIYTTFGSKSVSYNEMFDYYEWADGTPFGRRVEE